MRGSNNYSLVSPRVTRTIDGIVTRDSRNAEGDHAKAVSLLDDSSAISIELGMRHLMERVLSRREILTA